MKRWPVKVTPTCCGALEFQSDDLPVRGTGKAPRVVMPTISAANAVYSTTCSRNSGRCWKVVSTPFAPAVGLADAGANSDLVHELTGLAGAYPDR